MGVVLYAPALALNQGESSLCFYVPTPEQGHSVQGSPAERLSVQCTSLRKH